jgi:hypothetical protein
MYARSFGERRRFNVWSTAPIVGIAQYASTWRAWFHAKVATRSPDFTPRRTSAFDNRAARAHVAPYVVRSTTPSARRDTISARGNCVRARSRKCVSVSGKSIMSPSSIGSSSGSAFGAEDKRDGCTTATVEFASCHESVMSFCRRDR